jgi:mannosyltransferase OCH1-like enzyme
LDQVDFVTHEFPEFLPTYLSYPSGILRADIWRVLVLYKYGGVYADIDVECLKPIDELLARIGHDDWEILLTTDHPVHNRVHFGGTKMWMNDFMVAKPGSRFLKRVIEEFEKQGGGNHHPANAVFVTGPGLFTRIIEEMGGPKAAGVCEIPWQWVHPLPDMSLEFEEKEEYEQMIREGTWKQKYDPVVVHYWHHTWCRAGNTLQKYGHLLLTKPGEIVEERLQRFVPYLEKETEKNRTETVVVALTEFAQRGAGLLVELGVMRSYWLELDRMTGKFFLANLRNSGIISMVVETFKFETFNSKSAN